MNREEYNIVYYSLSAAQRRYIFDRKYISTNPRTKEVLIRKGFVKDTSTIISERTYSSSGAICYASPFTEKTHNMVKYRCEQLRKKQKEAFPDYIVIENDEQLLRLFQEIILLADLLECYIYYHSGINGFITANDVDYIIHPYYKWLIDIDKTSGRFLKYEHTSSKVSSYVHSYDNKGKHYV